MNGDCLLRFVNRGRDEVRDKDFDFILKIDKLFINGEWCGIIKYWEKIIKNVLE